MTSANTILDLRSVGVVRDGTTILSGVDWTVKSGEHWIILGPNGGGKSTLMGVAGLQLHPTHGEVTVLGHRLGKTDIRPLRRRRVGLSGSGMVESSAAPAHRRRDREVRQVRGAGTVVAQLHR